MNFASLLAESFKGIIKRSKFAPHSFRAKLLKDIQTDFLIHSGNKIEENVVERT